MRKKAIKGNTNTFNDGIYLIEHHMSYIEFINIGSIDSAVFTYIPASGLWFNYWIKSENLMMNLVMNLLSIHSIEATIS